MAANAPSVKKPIKVLRWEESAISRKCYNKVKRNPRSRRLRFNLSRIRMLVQRINGMSSRYVLSHRLALSGVLNSLKRRTEFRLTVRRKVNSCLVHCVYLTCICEHSQDMYILTLKFNVLSFNETEIIFIIT